MIIKRAYTLSELIKLRDIRLKGFNKNESLDDVHTNGYGEFLTETDIFLNWIAKMEEKCQIEYLITK